MSEQRPDAASCGGHADGHAASGQRGPQSIFGDGLEVETAGKDGVLYVGERVYGNEQKQYRGERPHYGSVVIACQKGCDGEQHEVQPAGGEDVEKEDSGILCLPDLFPAYQRCGKAAVHEYRTYRCEDHEYLYRAVVVRKEKVHQYEPDEHLEYGRQGLLREGPRHPFDHMLFQLHIRVCPL